MSRNRPVYLALVIITMALGLFTRSSYIPAKDGFIATYSGDVLWATMVYLIFCFIFPKWSALKIAIYALAFSFAIEFSQLNQQDWLNSIRHTRLGGLVLGFGYQSSDLVCYIVGVLLPYFIEGRLYQAESELKSKS